MHRGKQTQSSPQIAGIHCTVLQDFSCAYLELDDGAEEDCDAVKVLCQLLPRLHPLDDDLLGQPLYDVRKNSGFLTHFPLSNLHYRIFHAKLH